MQLQKFNIPVKTSLKQKLSSLRQDFSAVCFLSSAAFVVKTERDKEES